MNKILILVAAMLLTVACDREPYQLIEIPETEQHCRAAQQVITKTAVPFELVIHDSFDAFVKSKAIIDETGQPVIQQYNWEDDEGHVLAISCKLKSADHLNLLFGEGSAGPDGLCQDMNRGVFKKLSKQIRSPAFSKVAFDPEETVSNDEEPGMVGPDWLAPYKMTYVENDTLHIATKGFIINFTDPRFAKAPERFRGVHYCHLIAPGYVNALMAGSAPVDVVIGKEVDRSGPPPQGQ